MMTAPATIGFLLIPHFEETDESNFKPDLFLKCLDPTRILSSGFSWLPNFPWNIPYLYPSFGGLHLWGWNPPEKCHPFSPFSQVSPSGRPPWATRPGDLGLGRSQRVSDGGILPCLPWLPGWLHHETSETWPRFMASIHGNIIGNSGYDLRQEALSGTMIIKRTQWNSKLISFL